MGRVVLSDKADLPSATLPDPAHRRIVRQAIPEDELPPRLRHGRRKTGGRTDTVHPRSKGYTDADIYVRSFIQRVHGAESQVRCREGGLCGGFAYGKGRLSCRRRILYRYCFGKTRDRGMIRNHSFGSKHADPRGSVFYA